MISSDNKMIRGRGRRQPCNVLSRPALCHLSPFPLFRYDMRRGLLERFGSETIDKVFSEGQVEHTAMGNRFKVTFMLTKKVEGEGG